MDYEELYAQLQTLEKDLKDKIAVAQRTLKSMTKNSEQGDLKGLAKDLTQMTSFVSEYDSLTAEYTRLTEEFDGKTYMENGDFARQMIAYCAQESVDVKGEYPVYEMFPNKVKIDSENGDLIVDRKKVSCLRPQHFVKSIKKNQEKLNKASFNAAAFLSELSVAYDAAILAKMKSGKTSTDGQDLFLKDLHPFMVPMQRFRRDYDMQSYAFDLARLYSSDIEQTKDNKGFEFGTSRSTSKLIRILDKDGNEQSLATIRFFDR